MKQEGILHHAATRFLGLIPTLLVLITIAFFLIRVAPGGPFDGEKVLPPEIRANLDAKYHLDEPLLQQYFRYLGQIVSGDFGPSFQYRDWSVNELIGRGFPVSATIGVSVMVDSFRGSVDDWLRQTLQADVYAGAQRGSMDPGLLEDIAALDGIAAFSTSRRVQLEDADGRTQLLAIRMAPDSYAGTEIIDLRPVEHRFGLSRNVDQRDIAFDGDNGSFNDIAGLESFDFKTLAQRLFEFVHVVGFVAHGRPRTQ